MSNRETSGQAVDDTPSLTRDPGKSVARPILFLLATTVALAAFILGVGDVRRRSTAMEHARWYAAELQALVPEAGLLPLNLILDVPPTRQTKTYEVVSLAREDARVLRDGGRRILAAHTPTVVRNLAANGRAVIFFEDGRFQRAWLSSPEFEVISSAQSREIKRLKETPRDATPEAP